MGKEITVITLGTKMFLKVGTLRIGGGNVKSLLCWAGCGEEQERSSIA